VVRPLLLGLLTCWFTEELTNIVLYCRLCRGTDQYCIVL